MEEITYTCAGINHLSWFIKFEWKGRDAYPLVREAMRRPEVYNHEQVRNEMFLAFGCYVTESSGHNSEYNAWFRKRPDLIRKYCTRGTGWNPGVYAYILKEYRKSEKTWRQRIRAWLADHRNFSLKRGHEYAASIINARMGGGLFEFNGNVLNTRLVTNLPENCCVEVPVVASRRGFDPMYVGPLPPQCAALTGLQAQVEDMVVDASTRGDARLVYQAICHDPLTAAVCSLAEIRSMTQDLLNKHRRYLPQFKSVKI
jgi:alpha-galactosidase